MGTKLKIQNTKKKFLKKIEIQNTKCNVWEVKNKSWGGAEAASVQGIQNGTAAGGYKILNTKLKIQSTE